MASLHLVVWFSWFGHRGLPVLYRSEGLELEVGKTTIVNRFMVTGGAGFVGSHLVEALLAGGSAVVVVDNLVTGSLENLPKNDALTFVRRDVCSSLNDIEVDAIFHLACPASPVHYMADPVATLRTGFVGTENALLLAAKLRVPLVYSSTSEVYGDPDVSPQAEGYWGNVNSFGPRSCYDEGKRVGESLCYSYAERLGVRVRIARIFNTYGPRMAVDDGRVVSNFVVQALRGEPLTVYGDGRQTRSLCYVDDLVGGLMALMDAPGAPLEMPVNLGNPREMTIRDIAELVIALTDCRGGLDFRPLPQDDPRQRRPDIARAKVWLNWSPQVSVEDGLQRTVDYFKGVLGEK